MFGKCKVCAEKDNLAARLADEVAFLRGLVHPPVNNSHIAVNNVEANGLLDGEQNQITIETHAAATLGLSEAEIAEREALLGGTY